MSVTTGAKLAEIDSNLATFLEILPQMIKTHQGEYALMRHKSVVGYFKTAIDAQIAGNSQFHDRIFSIQQVKEVSEELGNFAHALHPRTT